MVNTLGPETESALLFGFLPYSRWSSFWKRGGGGNATSTNTRVARHLRVGKVIVTAGSEIPDVGITPLVSMSKEPVKVDLNATPLG